MKLFATILFLLTVLDMPLIAHGQAARPQPEQRLFSDCGSGTIRHKVTLSPEVLRKTNPSQLFRAAEVHLSVSDEVDLVVVGNTPFTGADNCWFWVVRSARKDPKVVLFSSGYSLEMMSSRTRGYRDIRSVWSSPNETVTVIYHFNGTDYQVWQKQERGKPALGIGNPEPGDGTFSWTGGRKE